MLLEMRGGSVRAHGAVTRPSLKAGPYQARTNDYTLANDLDCQFGEVAVGLGKMLLNAIYGSNLMDRPRQSTNDTRATGGLPKNGKRCPKNARRCPKNATNSNVSRVR